MGLQYLKEHISSLKLKEHKCLLELTRGKNLQTLARHTGLLKFGHNDTKGGNWSSATENDTAGYKV